MSLSARASEYAGSGRAAVPGPGAGAGKPAAGPDAREQARMPLRPPRSKALKARQQLRLC
jgi:hypothetical protein